MIEKILDLYNSRISNPRIKSIILHSLFWFVWLSRNLYDIVIPWGWLWSLIFVGIVFISQAPMVYLHLYVLVPKLLNKRHFVSYILLTALLIFSYSHWNYALMQALPKEHMPAIILRFLERLRPNFDLLEGLIVVVLTYSLKYTLIAFITQNELLRLQKEKLSLELNALKAQIHPHFLFNTLNNLYSLTLKNSNKASEVVLKLSDIMRYVLYQSNEDKVYLSKEIEFIRNYIELQRIRYNDRYEINFVVNGDPSKLKVAPLLFIDFIENAFKHGLEKRFNDGFVRVKFDINDDSIIFNSTNSKGQEVASDVLRESQGIGLNNVKRRLDLIYPGKFELDFKEIADVYEINLKLQLK